MFEWGDLFTMRQKALLVELGKLTVSAKAPQTALALAVSRTANANCSLARWHTSGEKIEGAFSRQALPLVWDFAEACPFSGSTGGYDGALEWVANVVSAWPGSNVGQVQQADATGPPATG